MSMLQSTGPRGLTALRPFLLATLALFTACGSDGPPAQHPPTSPQMTGVATYDATVVPQGVSVKGTAGLTRTNSNSDGTNRFSVSLRDLTGPYALRWIGGDASGNQVQLYGLATQAGVANVTPLTTLLVAQLLGQAPATAYSAFSGTSGHSELVTDANIQAAQAKVTSYLHSTLGVDVKSGTSSFVTTPFQTTAGDSMFDTIVALDAQLVANGTTLDAVATTLANAARLCITEKIEITIAAAQFDFCPATKSATPETADSTIIDYVYKYDPSTGVQTDSYYCQLSDCNGITFGPVTVNTDLGPDQPVYLHNVTLNDTVLAGANLDGTLTGTTATVKASFTMIYYTDPYNPLNFPPPGDCPDGDSAVAVSEDSGSFNFCSSSSNLSAFLGGDGSGSVRLIDDTYFSPIDVTFQGTAVTSVNFNSTVQQNFGCSTDCTGVTVSADDSGNVTLTFAGTVLHELQNLPLPPGSRTVTLQSGPIVIPTAAPMMISSVPRHRIVRRGE